MRLAVLLSSDRQSALNHGLTEPELALLFPLVQLTTATGTNRLEGSDTSRP